MKSFLLAVCFIGTISAVCCERSGDPGRACIVQSLKEKGLLQSDFPTTPVDPLQCFIMKNVVKALENGFYEKFDDKPSIEAECAKTKLKERQFFDYAMKKEVIEMSLDLPQEKATEMLKINREDMRKVLNEVSKDCNSDSTWAGVFDDVFGNKNTSLPVLEQNYCILSYLLDIKLIKLENVNRNPENINTSNLNCDEIVNNHLNQLKNDVKQKYEAKGMRGAAIDCVLEKFNKENLSVMLALNEMEKLEMSPNDRRQNKEQLEESLKNFMTSIVFCALRQN